MLMPEAAMHEDAFLMRPEDDVRFSGQLFCVKTVAISQTMKQFPNEELGLHIF